MSDSTASATATHHTGRAPLTPLARWERRAMPWIVVSAILPIVGAASGAQDTAVVVLLGFACWLVFLIDLIVHTRLVPGYLRTRAGRIDLAIVIFTCPWYLFVGSAGAVVTLARFARLARIVWLAITSSHARLLMARLGQAGIYAGGLLIACSLIVKWVEPASSGYATYGDAFWWGFVTMTTVGYGDLTPVTALGRIAAISLMVGGVALLGVLAGTLASFFGIDRDGDGIPDAAEPADAGESTSGVGVAQP